MKLFIFACLVATALATPEAEADATADPYLLYGRQAYAPRGYAGYAPAAYSGYNGYAGYGRGYGYAAYSPYSYGSAYGYRSLGKRDAEAEPTAEAEADPYLLYGANAGYSYGAPSAYRNYGYGVAAPSYAYAAAPAVAYSHVARSPYSVSPSYGGLAPYANYGNYFAKSGPVVHIAKRDAEAEPTAEAEADPYLLYNNFYNYQGGAPAYSRAYNTGYGYSGYAGAYRSPFGYSAYRSPYNGYSAYRGYYVK